MTTTDIPLVVDGGGRLDGRPTEGADSPAGARARVRARGHMVAQAGRGALADATGAWVWRDAPPALRDLVAARTDTSRALTDAPLIRLGWLAWNFIVAIPTTALLYVAAWVLQHPARTILAGLIGTALTLMWIK